MFPNRAPRHDLPAWSETRWFTSWNADDGVGLFVHLGRHRDDLDLLWVQSIAYLPDGTVAADRSWAHARDRWTVASNVFELRGRPDGSATARFRGVPELATPADLARHPAGAGEGTTLEWEVELRRTREPWVMSDHGAEFADSHRQLQYVATGTLTVDGGTLSLDGPAWGDHSSGARTWDGFGGHVFVNLALPDDGLVMIEIDSPERETVMTTGGVLTADGRTDDLVSVDCPRLTGLLGAPESFDLSVTTKSGRTLTWAVDVLHQVPLTITALNDNINGLDWRAAGDPQFLSECVARFTAPDGSGGYGHLERSVKRSRVEPETLAVRA